MVCTAPDRAVKAALSGGLRPALTALDGSWSPWDCFGAPIDRDRMEVGQRLVDVADPRHRRTDVDSTLSPDAVRLRRAAHMPSRGTCRFPPASGRAPLPAHVGGDPPTPPNKMIVSPYGRRPLDILRSFRDDILRSFRDDYGSTHRPL